MIAVFGMWRLTGGKSEPKPEAMLMTEMAHRN
jgi:hypothetical protein